MVNGTPTVKLNNWSTNLPLRDIKLQRRRKIRREKVLHSTVIFAYVVQFGAYLYAPPVVSVSG